MRETLIRFGNAWRDFAKIPQQAVTDILMVGGNASYCYNDSSDIDVHLVVDRGQLGFGPIVDEFLADRKSLWTMKHAIRVKGYPVEPYAQDVSQAAPAGQGVFSLTRNEWVQKPTQTGYDPSQDTNLEGKVTHWKNTIDKALRDNRSVEEMKRLKDRISEMRKSGIALHGEFSPENLVFKALRNDGYLDKINDHARNLLDKSLSLD